MANDPRPNQPKRAQELTTLRAISDEELAHRLAAHESWLETVPEGVSTNPSQNRADFSYTDLSGRDLADVDLRFANMTFANLRDADLCKTNLENASGLLAECLGGAMLTDAKLPPDVAKFTQLKTAAEVSKNARVVFLGLLAACLYSWLTIATAKDAELLTNSASSPLPIIQAEMPIAWFYWTAPLLLLGVYFYFHLYLQRLWRALSSLPSYFPDGIPLDDKSYP